MEDTISLFKFLNTLKKRWKLIFVTTMFATLIGTLVTIYVLTPVYQASTQMLVNQKDSGDKLDISLMQSNVDFISTYSMIIKSPAILEKVIVDLNLKESVENLNQHISITSQENSQVFFLTVEDSDPTRAVKIANSVSETFQKRIPEIMNVDNVSILAKAEMKENPTPVSPNLFFNVVVSVLVGILSGIALALLVELMDKTYKNDHEVEAHLGLPVIGSIEVISNRGGKKDASI